MLETELTQNDSLLAKMRNQLKKFENTGNQIRECQKNTEFPQMPTELNELTNFHFNVLNNVADRVISSIREDVDI